jgi:hypothetical protein
VMVAAAGGAAGDVTGSVQATSLESAAADSWEPKMTDFPPNCWWITT